MNRVEGVFVGEVQLDIAQPRVGRDAGALAQPRQITFAPAESKTVS